MGDELVGRTTYSIESNKLILFQLPESVFELFNRRDFVNASHDGSQRKYFVLILTRLNVEHGTFWQILK